MRDFFLGGGGGGGGGESGDGVACSCKLIFVF